MTFTSIFAFTSLIIVCLLSIFIYCLSNYAVWSIYIKEKTLKNLIVALLITLLTICSFMSCILLF